jgi:hypothetical protein
VIRIEKKHLFKTVAALPLCLVLFCYYFLPNYQTQLGSFSEAFCSMIFGSMDMENERVYLLTVENIAFIMLFNIMYTGYITSHFRYSCVYVFSRIKSRKGWFSARAAEIMIFAAVYDLFYILGASAICAAATGSGPNYVALYRMIIVYVFTFLVLVNTTLLINIIALRLGTAPGFFIVQGIVFGLIALLLATYDTKIMVILNPISCLNLFNQGMNTGWLTALNNLIILAVIFLFGRWYVGKYDVAMFDAEIN